MGMLFVPNKLSICIDTENCVFKVKTPDYKLEFVFYTSEVYDNF